LNTNSSTEGERKKLLIVGLTINKLAEILEMPFDSCISKVCCQTYS